MLIASHISAENTSRTVRAPSRAWVTQLATDGGVRAVEREPLHDLVARRRPARGRSTPMIASSASHDRRTPGSSRRPWTSAWKTPSSMRAVCSARESWRPIQ